MKYFKAIGLDSAGVVYVRHTSEDQALYVFLLFKLTHPVRTLGPLTKVGWWEGWCTFHGVHDDHEIVWEEADAGSELCWHSASLSRGESFQRQPLSK